MHFAANLIVWDLQVAQMGNTYEHHVTVGLDERARATQRRPTLRLYARCAGGIGTAPGAKLFYLGREDTTP